MSTKRLEYLKVLGLTGDATPQDIKQAFRKLALKCHPDKTQNGNAEDFVKIDEAYVFLNSYNDQFGDIDNNIEWCNIFDTMVSQLFEQFREHKVKTKKEKHRRKHALNVFNINLAVTLNELYCGRVKKIQVKVKKDAAFVREELFVSLFSYQRKYIFESKGDYLENGERGNVCVVLEIQEHPLVKKYFYDDIVSPFDLYMDIPITLYDNYCRKYLAMPYLNDELVEVEDFEPGIKCRVFKLRGLPYHNTTTNEDTRGDLILYFNLVLPEFPEGLDITTRQVLQSKFN
jgi:DnaJ-class molecular chaperone